ncbi:MAG: ClpXP protease specificity-enhancing factor [Gammaproteobacteria bacterium RIFCSPLOWO2_02_FULL_47_50]|jgi:stringent starvation protein B|nr:MAG: ClpXP protease specificity-enhancing factor [Gammaproteobacteria bacterium RIFCSPLOWO2_01_FULL_47_190]OGT75279.1 MAG: ClpXP protease specificity-enhancing factor [Gammaproteobacteria bacterium RIFCSPLOWO2_12_47_11]OGT78726.1 MAG: ClpXP protease specificity-enhancing factor [Gammaproteobacteria bacterium RIFCSPLOWO2_02_FULL_47_50]OGT87477.1 MAG: ClpXP protease specificity-enhancing factor [Gammaproteobacteria bacterium RIFCSPLOWO2_12_FULL_47_76]
MTPNRPYLLRALYEWILDNAMTPQLLVDTSVAGIVVPVNYIEKGRMILNIQPDAVRDLVLGNEQITFSARFGGKSFQLIVPLNSVLAVYARENGKGLIFEAEEKNTSILPEKPNEKTGKLLKPHLKVIK